LLCLFLIFKKFRKFQGKFWNFKDCDFYIFTKFCKKKLFDYFEIDQFVSSASIILTYFTFGQFIPNFRALRDRLVLM